VGALAAFFVGALLALAAVDLAPRVGAAVSAAAASDAVCAPVAAGAPRAPAPLAALAGRGSNSKPTLPSGWRTRYAENLRRVLFDTKVRNSSVLPSVSSFSICARSIGCCRMTLPERKSQLRSGPTLFSQT